jgi:hypothetical protein
VHHERTNDEREYGVLDDVRNLKVADIKLRQRLPTLECEWLVGQLCARPGIAAARCADDARHLTVEYDADELVSGDVVDFLSQCGVRVASVHPVRLQLVGSGG